MDKNPPTLIILGTGFAAFSLLKVLDTDRYRTIVVSPRNHFLFTPLLPSTTVGTIEFRSIIEPIRVARRDVQFYLAEAMAVDPMERKVLCQASLDYQAFPLSYDILVIAVGAANNTYNIPGVRENAMFLKEVADARAIRQKIIECFERASTPGLSEKERRQLLHFVVVGGGPTGVEFAAELHDFLRDDLSRWYPELAREVRITLLDAGKQILGTFNAALANYALRMFQREGIQVRTNTKVKDLIPGRVRLEDGSEIEYGLVVWSTGIGPTHFISSLPLPRDAQGRLLTDYTFKIKGAENIYAIGDCSVVEGENFPATAQAAQQEGKYLGRSLNALARGKPVKPFHYRHLGMLAYVGSNRALADLPHIKGRGFSTWLFWRSAYVTRLVSTKNKILVLFDWFKTLVFGRDVSRF